MTPDPLRELYQEIILDHYKRPRNHGCVEGATAHGEGHNPLCGDRIEVTLKLENDIVTEIAFDGAGCAISTASASLMTELVKGKSRSEVNRLFREFRTVVTEPDADLPDDLGDLAALAGVREHPVRIKCATLAWHTLNAALAGEDAPVKTE